MVDKRSVGHAYNIDFLNVVFAVSSLFLFFSTVWMVWDDYDREWKDYQRRFIELETEVTQASLELANSQVDYALIEQLQGELEQAREELADNQEQVDLLEGELDSGGFLKPPEKKPKMVRNLRNLFHRAGLTDQEVRTLRGVVSALTRNRKV